MYDRRNRYLMDRARNRRDRDMARGRREYAMQDMRNPYGSRGGYVSSDRRSGMYDSRMDSRGYDSEYRDRADYRGSSDYRGQDYHMGYKQYGEYPRHMDYEMYGYGMISPMHQDYARGRDRNSDYGYDYNYDYANMEKEYEEELKKWTDKLHRMDTRIKASKEQVLRQAKNMNIKFDEFTEEEFYATYLMMISDYPNVTNDYNVYIGMAKNWLMDKDAKLQGSDKLCTYLYEIVLGKNKEEDDD